MMSISTLFNEQHVQQQNQNIKTLRGMPDQSHTHFSDEQIDPSVESLHNDCSIYNS